MSNLLQTVQELKAVRTQVVQLKIVYGKRSFGNGLDRLVLCCIFSFLGSRDARRVLLVCRTWNAFLESDRGQALLLKICYPSPLPEFTAFWPANKLFKMHSRLHANWYNPDFQGHSWLSGTSWGRESKHVGYRCDLDLDQWICQIDIQQYPKYPAFACDPIAKHIAIANDTIGSLDVLDDHGKLICLVESLPASIRGKRFAIGGGFLAYSRYGTALNILRYATKERWYFSLATAPSGISISAHVMCVDWKSHVTVHLFDKNNETWNQQQPSNGNTFVGCDVQSNRLVLLDKNDTAFGVWHFELVEIDIETLTVKPIRRFWSLVWQLFMPNDDIYVRITPTNLYVRYRYEHYERGFVDKTMTLDRIASHKRQRIS